MEISTKNFVGRGDVEAFRSEFGLPSFRKSAPLLRVEQTMCFLTILALRQGQFNFVKLFGRG